MKRAIGFLVFMIMISLTVVYAQSQAVPGAAPGEAVPQQFTVPSFTQETHKVVEKLDFNLSDPSNPLYKAQGIPYEVLKGCYNQYFGMLGSAIGMRNAGRPITLDGSQKIALKYALALKKYLKSESKFGVSPQECDLLGSIDSISYNSEVISIAPQTVQAFVQTPSPPAATPAAPVPSVQERVGSEDLKKISDCKTIMKIADVNKNLRKQWEKTIMGCQSQFPDLFGKPSITWVDGLMNFWASNMNSASGLDTLAGKA